jgi:alkylation response protein AidB-like acyl-CoA dehydrogenase
VPFPAHYRVVQSLEQSIGDPFGEGDVFSAARAVRLDEEDAYPHEECAALDAWGLGDHYVPAAHGGKLVALDVLLVLLRAVARRNLSAAVAHGKTFLGGVPVWVAGTEAQRASVAARIRRGEQLALAYHERDRGSDLLATSTTAERTANGYALTGEKWLINNATRGTAMTVLASAPAGLSLFLVEKDRLDAGAYELLPPLRTAGVRGVDFSSVRFRGAEVAADALVGAEGGAVDLTVRAFQITRSVIPSLSLGAVDTALRTAMRFAAARGRVAGGTVLDIPQVQALFAGAFVDSLVCEASAIAAARALHVVPEQGSVISSAAKYFVPHTAERALRDVGTVLGARGYLREEHDAGLYQKLVRDHGVVAIFHAGSYLNINTIGQQLRALTLRAHDADVTALGTIFDVSRAVPTLDPSRLELSNRGRDDVLAAAPSLSDRARAAIADGDVEPRAGRALVGLVDGLVRRIAALDDAARSSFASGVESGPHVSVEMAELAAEYATLFAGACAVELWIHAGRGLGTFVASGDWLVLALGRLLRAPSHDARVAQDIRARLIEELRFRLDAGVLFSLLPLTGPS